MHSSGSEWVQSSSTWKSVFENIYFYCVHAAGMIVTLMSFWVCTCLWGSFSVWGGDKGRVETLHWPSLLLWCHACRRSKSKSSKTFHCFENITLLISLIFWNKLIHILMKSCFLRCLPCNLESDHGKMQTVRQCDRWCPVVAVWCCIALLIATEVSFTRFYDSKCLKLTAFSTFLLLYHSLFSCSSLTTTRWTGASPWPARGSWWSPWSS